MSEEFPKPEYIDDLTVREVYAELSQTLFGSSGILRIELCAHRWTQHPPIQIDRISPVVRFAIGFDTAKILRDQLTHCLNLSEKQTQLVQSPAASPTKN